MIAFEVLWIAVAVSGMLSHEVQYRQFVVAIDVGVGYRVFQSVVFYYHAAVEFVQLLVSHVKLRLAEVRVVEEEASAEVIYRFFCLRQKLVGDEGDVVASLPEQFGKQRVVTPFAAVADGMEREDVFEHEAREVPARHHVVKHHHLSFFRALKL